MSPEDCASWLELARLQLASATKMLEVLDARAERHYLHDERLRPTLEALSAWLVDVVAVLESGGDELPLPPRGDAT